MPILMTQASLVPCETQRIGPRTQRCSVLRTKRSVSADPPLESGLSTRNPTLQQERAWLAGRKVVRRSRRGRRSYPGCSMVPCNGYRRSAPRRSQRSRPRARRPRAELRCSRSRRGPLRRDETPPRPGHPGHPSSIALRRTFPSPDAQEGTLYPDRNPPGTKGRRGGWGERRPLVTHCTPSGDDPLPRRVALGSAATVVTLLPGAALSSVEWERQ